MKDRKRRRKNKLRGERTFGGGDTKNRRGSGTKGGKGRAGSKKHKFSKYYMFAGTLRKHKPKQKGRTMNVGDLCEKLGFFLEKKMVEKQGEMFVVDGKKLGIAKLLGKGSVTQKILLKNMNASSKTTEKIIQAGGKTENTQEDSKEEVVE